MGGTEEFFGDAEIKQKVEALWAEVFESSGKILYQHKTFGFSGIEVIPSPNIHQMLATLRLLRYAMDMLVDDVTDHESARQLLNARRQISNIEDIATALSIGNRGDYEKAIAALDGQCVI